MIPASIKNQVLTDVRACITEEGKDPEQCIIDASRRHRLSKEQSTELVELLAEDED
ncbi:MAG: hypothetical protein IMZ53_10895 [Thermoplasmata archaeon]|nr:hypothetical protein [Thermoplasmata archaeon]MBE3141074.1 hypothetical protein [Thermoplasmata archaeon]